MVDRLAGLRKQDAFSDFSAGDDAPSFSVHRPQRLRIGGDQPPQTLAAGSISDQRQLILVRRSIVG
jgi:hypothetical protein